MAHVETDTGYQLEAYLAESNALTTTFQFVMKLFSNVMQTNKEEKIVLILLCIWW